MAQRGCEIDILQLVDRLEEVLESGRRSPLGGRLAIDERAVYNIIDQMRIAIPQEIKQAREVQLERDKYIAQAHDEARRIIAQAREDAARLLDEHELRKQAQARAEATIQQAEGDALRIRAGADAYAETKLRELGQQVDGLQRVIQNGLAMIDSRRAQTSEAIANDRVARPKAQGTGSESAEAAR